MRNSPLESIKKTADFKQVYKHGKSFSNRYFVVYAFPNEKSCARLGLSISKKVGRAVARNKLRRWVKEYFRLNKRELPNVDFVVVARMLSAELIVSAKFSDVKQSLSNIVAQIVVEA